MILNMQTTSTPLATIGTLIVASYTSMRLHTIELPWKDNEAGTSCIPAGDYELVPYSSPTHGPTYCMHNPSLNIYGPGFVPEGGRSFCELHSANWARQLKGCIALGLEATPMLDPVTGVVEPAVENSKDAVAELLRLLGTGVTGHHLIITRA